MKPLRYLLSTFYFLLCALGAPAADLNPTTPPQDTDSATILMQKQAVSLWTLKAGVTIANWPGTFNIGNFPHVISSAAGSGYTVTTSSGTALAANASRKDAVLVNYGATGCFIARGATATAGQGIYLAPNGGSYNIDAHNLYRGIITAITASGTTTLTISEGQ